MFQSVPKKYTDKENKTRLAKYWAQIDLIDENIGRILKTLEETGQLDNTLIIFSSDHGDMTGDHGLINKGARFYESLVRVPLIFWYPSWFEQNLQSEALVELIDIVPTILELTGLTVDKRIQGKSLLPILIGNKPADIHKEFVRCESYDATIFRKNQTIGFATMYRDTRYKIINYHGHEKGELFDLTTDPNEFHNLWDDPEYSDVRFDLMKKSFDATVQSSDTGPERVGRY
jgi:arylsulfatase